MGRKRTPDAINEINGNPGKRKRLKAQQKPDPESATQQDLFAPDWLCSEGKKQFEAIAPRMTRAKLLTSVDVAKFAIGMDALGVYITAAQARNREMEEKGDEALITLSKDENKGKGPNPWIVIQSMAFKTFSKVAQDFGMSPSARAGLSLQPQTDMFDDVPSAAGKPGDGEEQAQPQSKAAKYLTQGIPSTRLN